MRDFVFPMFRANAIYEGEYLLGTSIARPLIAKRQIEIARMTGADAISHGATGKGNDQVRFELGAYALEPNIKVIAPVARMGSAVARKTARLRREARHPGGDEAKERRLALFSMDANLLHISYEGRILEDPAHEPEESMWRWTVSPEEAPDQRRIPRTRIQAGRHRRRQRQEADARERARRRSTSWAASTASAASTWWRTATSA